MTPTTMLKNHPKIIGALFTLGLAAASVGSAAATNGVTISGP